MAENPNEFDEFAQLFEQQASAPRRRVEPGEKVRGRIVHLGDKHAVLDLGGGLEGLLDLAGLVGKDGKPTVRTGDSVDGFVMRVRDRVVEVTLALGKGMADASMIAEAAETGVPVSGVVSAVNKGGYVVDLPGGLRGFCPLGQMDVRRIAEPAALVGSKLEFRVTEVRHGRDVTLSRRALLEETAAQKAQETRKRLEPGVRFSGKVTNIQDFGVFVDIGGIEGMVPASELAWGRAKPSDHVQVGQAVEVEVLRIEPGKDGRERITLSMRALAQDPFEALQPHLTPGIVLRGRVTRVEPFGAFVELVPGVEGLIHVSAFGRRIGRPAEVVGTGDEVVVRVDAVEPVQRRISLAWLDPEAVEAQLDPHAQVPPAVVGARFLGRLKAPEPVAVSAEQQALAPSVPRRADTRAAQLGRQVMAPPTVGSVHEVTVDKIEPFGVFVRWDTGRGLVPNADLGVPHGADVRRILPVGTTFKAAVIEVRADGKVRLSRTAADEAEQRAEAAAWQAQQQQVRTDKAPVGSFGELLQQKLGQGRSGK